MLQPNQAGLQIIGFINMDSKFDFYEIVIIIKSKDFPELIGKEGAILGHSTGEDGKSSYTISFQDLEHSYSFSEDDLEPTGKKGQRDDYY